MRDDVMRIVRLRDGIEHALKRHPESRAVVDAIALKLDRDFGDLGDRLGDSPEQREQNETARRERTLANLLERRDALIKRHRDEGLFKGLLGSRRD